MDHGVLEVVQSLLRAVGAHLTVLEELGLHAAVDAGHQAEDPDVELAVLNQQWLLDLLLDHPARVFGAALRLLADGFHGVEHFDALALVGILPGLHDPDFLCALFGVLLELLPLVALLFCVVVAHAECQRQQRLADVEVVLSVEADEVLEQAFLGTDFFVGVQVAENGLLPLAVFLGGDVLLELLFHLLDLAERTVLLDEGTNLLLFVLVESKQVVAVLWQQLDVLLLACFLHVDLVAPERVVL
mmetsp:Transcript_94895/g.204836  ORF Transcript_94895/g.204836 Transcript_94895/m.204836 type:complete len:244 (+) Transcript_94895:546-1277(+)